MLVRFRAQSGKQVASEAYIDQKGHLIVAWGTLSLGFLCI